MAASGRVLNAYHADLQDFLRATGYLPKNTEPVALGKMRKIPVISWVAAGGAPRERDRDDIQSWYTGQVDRDRRDVP